MNEEYQGWSQRREGNNKKWWWQERRWRNNNLNLTRKWRIVTFMRDILSVKTKSSVKPVKTTTSWERCRWKVAKRRREWESDLYTKMKRKEFWYHAERWWRRWRESWEVRTRVMPKNQDWITKVNQEMKELKKYLKRSWGRIRMTKSETEYQNERKGQS